MIYERGKKPDGNDDDDDNTTTTDNSLDGDRLR
jgi:hypothetical protein